MRALVVTALIGLAAGCTTPPPAARRATLNRTGGTTFQIIPGAAQYPYCLAFTVARNGLTRQLTMSKSNQSFPCPAGKPVAGHAWRVPLQEGPVRVYVFFTDQPVNAALVAQDLIEAADRQSLSALNLRLPGKVALEALDFAPEEDVAAEVGGLLGVDAGSEPDAGQN